MSPTNFTLFPKLPFELQLQVWEQVDIPASLISVSLIRIELSDGDLPLSFTIHYQLPAIFHVCHSSRKTALQSSPLRFSEKLFGPSIVFSYNAEKDQLLFAQMSLPFIFAQCHDSHFKTVRQIAIEPNSEDDYSKIINTMILLFQSFPQLQKIHVLPRDDKTSMLAALAEVDGGLDYARVDATLLHLYTIRVFLLRTNASITEEKHNEFIKRDSVSRAPRILLRCWILMDRLREKVGIHADVEKVG
ncbi:hypothetical protein VTL71DRAFT_7569 [Oculimacula yallundae]|uniref:2EXR domain-containing protein n=1 Tax=Oculimacula yallundae TaxID=86028 RepID=A0ABR4BVN9_9HELO